MATYKLISSATVGVGGATSIAFSSIPATYTDLKLICSVRESRNGSPGYMTIALNGSTANFTNKDLFGDGINPGSQTNNAAGVVFVEGNNLTANTFSSTEVYIPNYAGSTNKSISSESVQENNGTGGTYMQLNAMLWSNTAAITSITLTPNTSPWLQYSTAYLYGISKN